MIAPRPLRQPALIAVLLTAAALVSACGPAAGPLGTPASPALTPAGSDEPTPSDVAPGTATPTAAPTEAPTEAPSDEPSANPTSTPRPTAVPAETMIVRTYFMLGSFSGNPGLVPTLREPAKSQAVARAAMQALLEGPNDSEMSVSPAMYTGIPEGTELVDLAIANGTATVTLSGDFEEAAANSQLETATAQVVFTLTQFSTVDSVTLVIVGGDTTSGLTRADFQEVGILPAIFVDRPAWGAAAGNPMRVAGLANVFEATFQVQVLNGRGAVIAEKTVTASCGTGCWGSFRTDVAYTVARAQYGTLRVYADSAKDGSPVDVTEYKVWLTPGQ